VVSLIEVLVVVVMLLVVGDWLMASWSVGVMLVDGIVGIVAAPGAVSVGGSCTCRVPVPVDNDENDDSLEIWGC
jgi:hypothetical protein